MLDNFLCFWRVGGSCHSGHFGSRVTAPGDLNFHTHPPNWYNRLRSKRCSFGNEMFGSQLSHGELNRQDQAVTQIDHPTLNSTTRLKRMMWVGGGYTVWNCLEMKMSLRFSCWTISCVFGGWVGAVTPAILAQE